MKEIKHKIGELEVFQCPESLNSLDPDFNTFTLWGNILENSNWVKNK